MQPVVDAEPSHPEARREGAPDHVSAVGDSAKETTKRLICDELRKARKAKGWSQAQLGEAINASRFMVNRLESGTNDLRADVAERIELALGVSGLVALVAKREQLGESDDWRDDRDSVLRRLLRTPRLQRVRIVLVDDLDVHALMAHNPAVVDASIEVIVPTAVRERQLFGDQPLYGHIENQIRRLSEHVDGFSTKRGLGAIQLFESPAVLSPAVLIDSPAGTECAYWPVAPSGSVIEGTDLLAVSSLDSRVTAKIDAHIDAVKRQASRIQKNEAVAIVDPQPQQPGEDRPIIFTRFETGSDPEELGPDEAFAVALVLIHTVCPRRDLGIKRRVLVCQRRDYGGRWSLPGHSVGEVDVRRTRRSAERLDFTDLSRSSSDKLASTLEHADYFAQTEGAIPLDVFKEAASRGLWADFGVEVDINRLQNVVLPPELQRISKDQDDDTPVVRRIVPRLFTLDLTKVTGAPTTHELSEIKRRAHRANVDEWGYEDLAERDDLNDFLVSAKNSGLLLDLCRDLGVAPR
ncbi:MAG: helix-turn-helix domain-containing protein [Acidimicrobiales bacterium]